MNEHLARLETLDPTAYQRYVIFGCGISDHPDKQFLDGAILQAVLQEAIRARGWGLMLLADAEPRQGSLCYARIEDRETLDDRGVGEANTPAGAILAAYVATLEELK